MNKGELISFISESNNCTKTEAERSLDMIVSGIISAMGSGNDVNLVGFGSFNIKRREARVGRNPKTGKTLEIPAHNYPTFKVGKTLKEACNK